MKTDLTIVIEATPAIQSLAREAIRVLDASNLCGVAQGFARRMVELRDEACPSRQHPIIILWADKLADLAGLPSGSQRANDAYEAVQELAEGRHAAWPITNRG